jgi:hypothetical protein
VKNRHRGARLERGEVKYDERAGLRARPPCHNRTSGEAADYQLAPPVAVLTEPAAIDLVITNVLLVAPDFDFDVAVMT